VILVAIPVAVMLPVAMVALPVALPCPVTLPLPVIPAAVPLPVVAAIPVLSIIAIAIVAAIAAITAVFRQDIAQQPACGCAAQHVKRVALRQNTARRRTESGAEHGVAGALVIAHAACEGDRHQPIDRKACDVISCLHGQSPKNIAYRTSVVACGVMRKLLFLSLQRAEIIAVTQPAFVIVLK
jgi:hypothetical protein